MLKKINRGFKRKDFESIFSGGRTFQTPLFGVRFKSLPTPLFEERGGDVNTRVGWIISKKISKKAVDRNKIKRRLSEVIKKDVENNLGGNGIPPVQMIILVKKNILEASVEEISKCWRMFCERNH
jgi:ribonuclease P protein component